MLVDTFRASNMSAGLSPPMSDAASATSPRSPRRKDAKGSPGATEVSAHAFIGTDGLAPRACEKCRSSKRKCDKTLPNCTRCTRLNARCVYLQDPMSSGPGSNGAPVVVFQPHSVLNDVLRGSDPLDNVTAPHILSLVSLDSQSPDVGMDWRTAVEGFFQHVHPWFAVVHRPLFDHKIAMLNSADKASSPDGSHSPSFTNGPLDQQLAIHRGLQALQTSSDALSKDLALLVVSMHLVTRIRSTDQGERPMFDETYRSVKRVLSLLLVGCGEGPLPSIELVQCGALIAMYEYGHGDSLTAYRTLSETVAAARVLGIRPGREFAMRNASTEPAAVMGEEQRSGLWWGMFILDQFLHWEVSTRDLPFVLEAPTPDTLLPTTPLDRPPSPHQYIDSNGALSPPPPSPGTRRLSVSMPIGTPNVGSFQLSAQVAALLHRALRCVSERQGTGVLPPISDFSELDQQIRTATMALLEQDMQWELVLDVFAMCVSALFALYLPYLPILERATPEQITRDPQLGQAMAALRFAAQLSTDISCKVNAKATATGTSVSLAVLSAPAAPTCYLVIVAYAGFSRIFPEEYEHCREAIEEKFESLRLFSRRWGIAEKMMIQLEEKNGLDRNLYLRPESQSPPIKNGSIDMDIDR